jgi:hypothetical protein
MVWSESFQLVIARCIDHTGSRICGSDIRERSTCRQCKRVCSNYSRTAFVRLPTLRHQADFSSSNHNMKITIVSNDCIVSWIYPRELQYIIPILLCSQLTVQLKNQMRWGPAVCGSNLHYRDRTHWLQQMILMYQPFQQRSQIDLSFYVYHRYISNQLPLQLLVSVRGLWNQDLNREFTRRSTVESSKQTLTLLLFTSAWKAWIRRRATPEQ